MPPKITRVRWSASNLAWGISFDESTGKFSGTPDEAGEYDVPVKVETNYGSDEQYVHISVAEKVHWEKVSISHNIVAGTPVMCRNIGSTGTLIFYTYNTYYCYRTTSNLDNPNWTEFNATSSNAQLRIIYGTPKDYSLNGIFLCGYSNALKIIVLYNSKAHAKTPNGYTTYDWRAASYSPQLNKMLYVAKNGTTIKIGNPNAVASSGTSSTMGMTGYSTIEHGTETNPNCAAWSPIVKKFCISAMGYIVATSSDGDTWEIGSAPDNLLELEFRSDLGKFFARGEYSNLFYVSDDGLNWTQYNNTPIPLNTVKSVAFSSAYGYCAIGIGNDGTQQYSAHSRDLENWIFKKIDNNENIDLTNVVYAIGNISSFVAVPASGGNYLYRLKGTTALQD